MQQIDLETEGRDPGAVCPAAGWAGLREIINIGNPLAHEGDRIRVRTTRRNLRRVALISTPWRRGDPIIHIVGDRVAFKHDRAQISQVL